MEKDKEVKNAAVQAAVSEEKELLEKELEKVDGGLKMAPAAVEVYAVDKTLLKAPPL